MRQALKENDDEMYTMLPTSAFKQMEGRQKKPPSQGNHEFVISVRREQTGLIYSV
ncbi:hypothetical protein QG37_00019 [Candidozyma auris]|uniref:Uncharacterized protein n=1 Tax=Candidozyma auris TaxID=498019 RepID=A0A0L0P8F5_CANAR|nr:hypothetical protein QG37_00019 [[Candida] auris]